jgi:hypothetical protein
MSLQHNATRAWGKPESSWPARHLRYNRKKQADFPAHQWLNERRFKPMSEKSNGGNFLSDNPERVMIILFPLITLALFVVGAVLWGLINNYIAH